MIYYKYGMNRISSSTIQATGVMFTTRPGESGLKPTCGRGGGVCNVERKREGTVYPDVINRQ